MKWLKFITVIITIFFVHKSFSFELYSELKNVNYDIENSTCAEDIALILSTAFNTSIKDREWALRMLDSSAKVPNGLLDGSLVHIGQFDECLKVVQPDGYFIGKHCMTNVVLQSSSNRYSNLELLKATFGANNMDEDEKSGGKLSLQYGMCLPSTCSSEELNKIFNFTSFTDVISVSVNEGNCWTSDPIPLSGGSWGFISFLIILISLTACSTLHELYQIHINKNDESSILCAFSLYSNTVSLFEIRESSGEMACLHGMRTLSMMWVLLCHTFGSTLSFPIINLIEAMGVTSDINYILIINGFFSVDSFFFLSGLLVAFVFFRNIGKNGYYDAPSNYIHRYLRLTPSLLIVVLFNMTVLGELNKGPMWGLSVTPISADCRETWWSTILYVQNYAQPLAQCVGQSWYLSADMQMFWIAPLVLYPILLWPKIGMAFLALLTIGSTLLTFGLAYENDYKATMLIMTSLSQFTDDYIATHSRITPWFVGVALGVAICGIKSRKINIKLSKMVVMSGWVFSTGVCLGILYGYSRFQGDYVASAAESAIYLSFTRLGWGVGLAWIVFACIYGYGGWVNSILSQGIFQPLGKLSYNVYLVHMTILTYNNGTFRTYFYFTNFSMIFNFFGTLMLSYLFATALYLLVDAPVSILDRKLLRNIKIFPYPMPKKEDRKPIKDEFAKGDVNISIEKSDQQ